MAATASRVLVVGSGAIGLRTSVELLRRGVSVVLRSSREPLDPANCSFGAGGWWFPFHCDDVRVDRWALETLHYYLQNPHQEPVEIVPAVLLKRQHQGPKLQHYLDAEKQDATLVASREGLSQQAQERAALPGWTTDSRVNFQHLSLEMLAWQNSLYKLHLPCPEYFQSAGYQYAWLWDAPVVDSPRMLKTWWDQVQSHALGGNVQTNCTYDSPESILADAQKENCNAIVNCAGLACRTLFSDESHLVGARGVVLNYNRATTPRRYDHEWTGRLGGNSGSGASGSTHVWRDACIGTEEAPWGSHEFPVYVVPRGNVLVVGGTYLEGDDEPNIRPQEMEFLQHAAHQLGIDVTKAKPEASWVGFRPFRSPKICVEVDSEWGVAQGIPLVHNYGHGGAGWTLCVGAAREVCSLLGVEEERHAAAD